MDEERKKEVEGLINEITEKRAEITLLEVQAVLQELREIRNDFSTTANRFETIAQRLEGKFWEKAITERLEERKKSGASSE